MTIPEYKNDYNAVIWEERHAINSRRYEYYKIYLLSHKVLGATESQVLCRMINRNMYYARVFTLKCGFFIAQKHLCATLGLSRTAVQSALRNLREMGLVIAFKLKKDPRNRYFINYKLLDDLFAEFDKTKPIDSDDFLEDDILMAAEERIARTKNSHEKHPKTTENAQGGVGSENEPGRLGKRAYINRNNKVNILGSKDPFDLPSGDHNNRLKKSREDFGEVEIPKSKSQKRFVQNTIPERNTQNTIPERNTQNTINERPSIQSENYEEAPATQTQNQKGPRRRPAFTESNFEDFYAAYPRRTRKADARKAWLKLNNLPKSRAVDVATVMQAMQRYAEFVKAEGTEKAFIKHPASFLNGAAWESLEEDLEDKRAIRKSIQNGNKPKYEAISDNDKPTYQIDEKTRKKIQETAEKYVFDDFPAVKIKLELFFENAARLIEWFSQQEAWEDIREMSELQRCKFRAAPHKDTALREFTIWLRDQPERFRNVTAHTFGRQENWDNWVVDWQNENGFCIFSGKTIYR